MKLLAPAVMAAMLFHVQPTTAEVVDAAESGFTVRTQLEVAAPPAQVYTALTDEIARWWHPDHTYSGDSANLYLEARAGGIFGERLPDGGTVKHLEVLYADPGRLLRLGGGLGPLQAVAVTGALTVQLEATTGGTRLTMTYAVGGYAPQGLQNIAGPVDGVLVQQMARLKAHVES